jgi:hypothetical protein
MPVYSFGGLQLAIADRKKQKTTGRSNDVFT